MLIDYINVCYVIASWIYLNYESSICYLVIATRNSVKLVQVKNDATNKRLQVQRGY